jgi:legumain
VTKEKFFAVLQGDAETAGGKVLKSNSNSKVFVFYADHGAPGFVQMPTGLPVYADELGTTIDNMK